MQVNRAPAKCGFQKTWRLEHLVRNLYADALRTAPIRRGLSHLALVRKSWRSRGHRYALQTWHMGEDLSRLTRVRPSAMA